MVRGQEVPLRVRVIQDAGLVDQGMLGVEMGFTADPGDKKTLPIYFEYGLSDSLNVFFDFSAYEKVNLPGDDGEGLGDTAVGMRTLLFESEAGTRALLEGQVRFPTGDDDNGTGTGSVDWFAAGVLSQTFAQATFSAWLELGLLGSAFGSDPDDQQRVGASVAANLTDQVLGFLEVESERAEDLNSGYARFGLAWRQGASVVMDAGVALGIEDDAADAVYFLGFTTLLGVRSYTPLPPEAGPR